MNRASAWPQGEVFFYSYSGLNSLLSLIPTPIMTLKLSHTALLLLFCFSLTACSGESSDTPSPASSATEQSGLSQTELEHGIGPIEAFDPGPIDATLVAKGLDLFTIKCSACHQMGKRYVGPDLQKVTTTRSPAFVMNMILNPEEMIQKHPEAKALFEQFMTPMANQSLTEDEARAILEYLRQVAVSQ